MSSEGQKNHLTRVDRLAALLRDDSIDIEAMSADQLALYLKENHVEIAGPQKRFGLLLKKAKVRQRLEIARRRRLEGIDKAKSILSLGGEAIESVRVRVQAMIDQFASRDPEHAKIYAREFESATPEDLKILEEDLTLLEMENPNDEKGDKPD